MFPRILKYLLSSCAILGRNCHAWTEIRKQIAQPVCWAPMINFCLLLRLYIHRAKTAFNDIHNELKMKTTYELTTPALFPLNSGNTALDNGTAPFLWSPQVFAPSGSSPEPGSASGDLTCALLKTPLCAPGCLSQRRGPAFPSPAHAHFRIHSPAGAWLPYPSLPPSAYAVLLSRRGAGSFLGCFQGAPFFSSRERLSVITQPLLWVTGFLTLPPRFHCNPHESQTLSFCRHRIPRIWTEPGTF